MLQRASWLFAAVFIATATQLDTTQKRPPPPKRRRFYERVSVYKTQDGYGVNLDHRKLRTPQRREVVLPTEPLALAVAHEWQCQDSPLQPSIMHLTALCNTVLDDPHQTNRTDTVDTLLSRLNTDTLLYRQEEPADLAAMQEAEWTPVINWFNSRFGVLVQQSASLQPQSLPPPTLSSLSHYLHHLDSWSFQGLWYAVDFCQSLILTVAMMEDHLTVESVADLSRLEIRHQIRRWGNVEWQHDVEYHDLCSRLATAHLIAKLAQP